jgi:cytochrome P450
METSFEKKSLPFPDPITSLHALRAMLSEGHPLAAMQVFHRALGDIFQVNLPAFTPVVMVGPQAARFVLVQARDDLRWRNENDPVVGLLRHGVLVEDGTEHDALRKLLNPALHKQMLSGYVAEIWRRAGQVSAGWLASGRVDMLVEMRKVALLSLMHTLYRVEFSPQLEPLWNAILGNIGYISPGLWMIWRGVPRPGYRRSLEQMDRYLYAIIDERQELLSRQVDSPTDMLGLLVASGMEAGLIRDQLLTMLIAGHDTVTALMAWTLHLLGQNPEVYRQAQAEARAALDPHDPPTIEQVTHLEYLGWVIREALRLYPPIHLGSRVAAVDLEYNGYPIPAGERVVYSIYLTQRHPDYWAEPDRFLPERHAQAGQTPYAWLAFGGGPRNCIGAAYGQLEARLVIGYILRNFKLQADGKRVRPHMGATLEPHPGVGMLVRAGL